MTTFSMGDYAEDALDQEIDQDNKEA